MTDNIKVCCRFRRDKEGEELDDWEFDQETKSVKLREKKFTYDEVLDMNCDQAEMYEKVAAKCIEDFVQGYHGTLFAYGNSGSGKTYSIVGPDDIVEYLAKDFSQVPEDIQKLYGVIPRATISIFNAINETISAGGSATLHASYIEIYNETITCLLNQKENLKIHEIPKVGFQVSGKELRPCTQPEDIFKVLYIGTKNKTIGGTLQNARSSRSHTILVLELKTKSLDGSEKVSKLNIVDLAGSEKLKNTGANTPERVKEAQKINLSLTTLGMCIMALTENANFVPYRNSKLTIILKESLGGNSKTTLLCAARRDKKLVDDNLNSLYFAQRAKAIKTKSVKNVKLSDKENEFLIKALKQEILDLRKQLKDFGHNFKPITDPKFLQLLEGDLSENQIGNEESSESTNNESDTNIDIIKNMQTKGGSAVKRNSLINLSEDQIIYKYCELRAKYDNLLENSGNKIFNLTNQMSTSNIDPEKMNELNQIHEDEVNRLKKDCSDEKERLLEKISRLEVEKNKLIEEVENSKEDYKSLQEMLDLNTMDIEAMNTQVSEKEQEVSLLNSQIESLNNQISNKDQELKTRDKYIDDSRSKLGELTSKLEESSALLIKQKEELIELESLKNEIKSLKKVNSDQQILLNESESLNSKNTIKISELLMKISELENLNKLNESKISLLNSEVESMKKNENQKISDKEILEQKETMFNEIKNKLEQQISNLVEQNNVNTKLNSESLNELNSKVESAKEEANKLKNETELLNLEISKKNLEVQNLKSLMEEISNTKEDKLKTLSKEFEDFKFASLDKEKEFNNSIQKYENEVSNKKKEIIESESKYNSSLKEYEKNLKDKENEIQKISKERDNLSKESSDSKEYIQKLLADIKNLEQKIEELKALLAASHENNKALVEVSSFYFY